MTIQAINPVTGELLATYPEMAPDAVGAIIRDVHKVFLQWTESVSPSAQSQCAGRRRSCAPRRLTSPG